MDWLHHFRSKPTIQDIYIQAQKEAERMAKVKSIETALSRIANTPDVAELSNKSTTVLFVYNDLMKKYRDHEILEPIEFCGDALTVFEVNGWYRKKDRLPIVMKPQILSRIPSWGMQKNAHAAVLKGEVYIIRTNKLFELDLYHDNGTQFIRQRIDVDIPYETDIETKDRVIIKSGIFHKTKQMWAYLGNPDYWWGEADAFVFARNNHPISNHYINSSDFEPMTIHTPKKTWKSLYYYHGKQYSS